ncbi:MAG: hypothetical protein IKK98_00430, partial [Oscillospiraceae bacterium]|nr:hypothetical protein [Oscillospiraceae bacterium]
SAAKASTGTTVTVIKSASSKDSIFLIFFPPYWQSEGEQSRFLSLFIFCQSDYIEKFFPTQ